VTTAVLSVKRFNGSHIASVWSLPMAPGGVWNSRIIAWTV
jgi:hypothetical protein